MKNFVLLILFLFTLSIHAYSQDYPEIDQRLKVKYSPEDIARIQATQPLLLQYETYKLDHSWYFIELEIDSDKPLPMLFNMDYTTKSKSDLVVEIDVDNFNILNYYIEPRIDLPVVYKIGNTGLALVIIPEKKLAENFNNSLKE
jgi:hypothetical protein